MKKSVGVIREMDELGRLALRESNTLSQNDKSVSLCPTFVLKVF